MSVTLRRTYQNVYFRLNAPFFGSLLYLYSMSACVLVNWRLPISDTHTCEKLKDFFLSALRFCDKIKKFGMSMNGKEWDKKDGKKPPFSFCLLLLVDKTIIRACSSQVIFIIYIVCCVCYCWSADACLYTLYVVFSTLSRVVLAIVTLFCLLKSLHRVNKVKKYCYKVYKCYITKKALKSSSSTQPIFCSMRASPNCFMCDEARRCWFLSLYHIFFTFFDRI